MTSTQHPPQQYLVDLARRPIGDLPDPTATDVTYPLLYRLARLSLSKATLFKAASKSPGVAGLKVDTRTHFDQQEQSRVDAATASIAERSLQSLVGDRGTTTVDRSVVVTAEDGSFEHCGDSRR